MSHIPFTCILPLFFYSFYFLPSLSLSLLFSINIYMPTHNLFFVIEYKSIEHTGLILCTYVHTHQKCPLLN